ncbi:MAG: hypothetical protein V3U92_14695 [Cellulophaga sp.]
MQKVVADNLYEKLLFQLQKDFERANVSISLDLDVKPRELHVVLQEKIYYLLLEKFTDYLNLLYVIDVPEKEFKSIKVTDVVEIAEQVTLLILKRELQKILLKIKYDS